MLLKSTWQGHFCLVVSATIKRETVSKESKPVSVPQACCKGAAATALKWPFMWQWHIFCITEKAGTLTPPISTVHSEQPPQPNEAVPAGELCGALLKYITWALSGITVNWYYSNEGLEQMPTVVRTSASDTERFSNHICTWLLQYIIECIHSLLLSVFYTCRALDSRKKIPKVFS